MNMDFALYIPVRGTAIDFERAEDVIDSVDTYSERLRWVVVVDDSLEDRPWKKRLHSPAAWALVVLKNPRKGVGDGHTGGLCAADIAAFRHIYGETDAQFVLKLDSDSLVIGSFEHQVQRALRDLEKVGMLGVIGDSFGDNRTYKFVRMAREVYDTMLRLPNDFAEAWIRERQLMIQLGVYDAANFKNLKKVTPLIQRAISNDSPIGEYCQGGGYVVSREFLSRIAAEPLLADAAVFLQHLTFGEDVIMGLICGAVGLRMYDLSRRGEPFAIHPFCLPFSCEEISGLGRSIIHSINGSAEAEYRGYFKDRRRCFGN
jgi:hypothetical protein